MRFDELTRQELRELAPDVTVVLPVGSTEQHGPHLPVGTDVLIVSALAERAVEQAQSQVPVLLAPTVPFGFAHHHLPFGATISIGLPAYVEFLTEIGKSLVVSGFRRLVIVNGHGGNDSPIRAVADRLVFQERLDLQVAATSYWTGAADALADLVADGALDVGPVPGHAGGFETSCVLALRPALVRTDKRPHPEPELQPVAATEVPGITVRRPELWPASDGRTDDSQRADAAAGARALDAIAARLARFIVDFHQSTDR